MDRKTEIIIQNNTFFKMYKGKRYWATEDNVNDVLKQYGLAIIPSVLDDKECSRMKKDMWNYLEQITKRFKTPIDRHNQATWREFKRLFPKHSMLLQQWGIGHCEMVWRLRQNPKIYKIFCKIYGVKKEELLTSFDGASFHFPPEITGSGFRRSFGWLHCDQSFLRNRRECIQSWVTANDVEEGDATLVFLEGSHKFHSKFRDHWNKLGDFKADWYKLSEEQIAWYKEMGCEMYCIRCPKGSLVLWDSRTIHSGTESLRLRPNPKIRCVAYICFMPRGETSQRMLKKKQKAFEELRTTSHWPCNPKLFPKTPRTYGAPLPDVAEIDPPTVSKIGLTFAGY